MLTPIEQSEKLAKAAGVTALFLKREDMTPTGSFKFRSAQRQMESLVERGKEYAVVSSSGNAAISLAYAAKIENKKLFAFVSPKMSKGKLAALLKYYPIVIVSKRAMRLANYMSAHHRMRNMRPSVDDHAVVGLISLGEEIDEQMEEFGGAASIVSFMTSGSSMVGMMKGYRSEPRPKFVAVTSERVGALGTSRSPRQVEVEAGAQIVSVSDEDFARAQKVIETEGLEVADEAIASFAWIMANKPEGNVVWVVSGKKWPNTEVDESKLNYAEDFEAVNKIYDEA